MHALRAAGAGVGPASAYGALGASDVLSSLDLWTRTEFRIKISEKLLVSVYEREYNCVFINATFLLVFF